MPLAFLLVSTIVACGGQKAAPAASADAAPVEQGVTGDYPADANSQAFVESLTSLTIEDFAAVDGMGAQVILAALNFAGDNSWSASGYVDAGEERMECTESGTWTMDPAESKTVANINWVIAETDCIGREAGTEVRAHMTINGSEVAIAFH